MSKRVRLFVIAAYDVADDRRRARVASEMENFGRRVQYSVFECRLDWSELSELRWRIGRLLDLDEDRVDYYLLCRKDHRRIAIDGPGALTEDPAYFIV